MEPGRGLLDLDTAALKKLLRHLHRGELECPIDAKRIACVGFQYRQAELMNSLRGLDEPAVRAVLVCVLAERQHNEGVSE